MSKENNNLVPQAIALAVAVIVGFIAGKLYYEPKVGSAAPVYQLAAGSTPSGTGGVSAGLPDASLPSALDPRDQGDVLFGQGRYAEAIVQYREAIKADPKDADSHNDLGLSLHYTGKTKEAIEILKKGTKADPKLQIIWLTLGFVSSNTPDKKTAEEALTKAVLLDPNSPRGKEAAKMLERLKSAGN
jgi:tetratricopeptide (TPR) repeat protein